MRKNIKDAARIVVKLGTSTVSHQSTGNINIGRLDAICRQIADLVGAGKEVILVSSGAIGLGRNRMGVRKRPSTIPEKQAYAAIGQGLLIHMYQKLFSEYGLTAAQILLTRDDISNRERYLNARETINQLIGMAVIPIINENDTVAVDDINFGDNDLLSAHVALLIDADILVMLTDTDGLYTADPRIDSKATIIKEIECVDSGVRCLAGASITTHGTGGMLSKVEAASIVAQAGLQALIANGSSHAILPRIFEGEVIGTYFHAIGTRLENRKRWIAFSHKSDGKIVIDTGAAKAISIDGKSLLPSGIISVEGDFNRGATIEIIGESLNLVGKGLVNYNSDDVKRIIGKHSRDISRILGYNYSDEIIHRDNLVIFLLGGNNLE